MKTNQNSSFALDNFAQLLLSRMFLRTYFINTAVQL